MKPGYTEFLGSETDRISDEGYAAVCDKRDDFFRFLLQKKRCCPNKQAGTIETKEIAAGFSMAELIMTAGGFLKGTYVVDSCFLLSLLSPVLIPSLNGTV